MGKFHECAWCGRKGYMEFVTKRPPWRSFCNESCLRKWEWITRNGEVWLKVKETNNGKKES